MAAHVDGDHPIIARQVRRDVIERVRVPGDPVQHDERRLFRSTPVEIVQAQAVDRDKTILKLRGRRRV